MSEFDDLREMGAILDHIERLESLRVQRARNFYAEADRTWENKRWERALRSLLGMRVPTRAEYDQVVDCAARMERIMSREQLAAGLRRKSPDERQ